MKPTLEEIRLALASHNPDDQVVIADEDEVVSFVETFALQIRDFTVKVFRWPKLRRVIFVVIMSLSALDGIQVAIPNEADRAAISFAYQNQQQWTQDVGRYTSPETQNKYFMFGSTPYPTPIASAFLGPDYTTLIPISGAMSVGQNLSYQVYNPNRGGA